MLQEAEGWSTDKVLEDLQPKEWDTILKNCEVAVDYTHYEVAVEQVWSHDLYAALHGSVKEGHWQNQKQGPEALEYWLDKAGALCDCHQGATDGELGSPESVGPRLGVEHLKHLDVGVGLQATRHQHSRDKKQQETLEESERGVADENLVDDMGTTATTMDIVKLKTVATFRPVTERT